MTLIRSLAFADLATGWWGAAWAAGEDASMTLAWRCGEAAGVLGARLQVSGPTEPWRVEGEEISLRIGPAGPVARGRAASAELATLDQLCTVSGKLMLGGSEREISAPAWRATIEGDLDLEGIDSFRQTAGWLETNEGFSLIALRPRGARGHDADLLAAAVLEGEPAPPVADPRLSTTYDASGLPVRAGLELWFEEEDEEGEDEGPEDDRERFPRRAAGEAIGPGIDWEAAGFKLHSILLRWHSGGNDGAGVYLLGRRE